MMPTVFYVIGYFIIGALATFITYAFFADDFNDDDVPIPILVTLLWPLAMMFLIAEAGRKINKGKSKKEKNK